MVRRLLPLYKQWQTDKELHVVVMKGAGGKAFCAGSDRTLATDLCPRTSAPHSAPSSGDTVT
jgi:enoyl-CoA hydratase/carnithine racemase